MKKKLVLVGAGGFGREIVWQISQAYDLCKEYNVLGFVDDAPDLVGKTLNGYPVIGNVAYLCDFTEAVSAVICIGNSNVRKSVVDKLSHNSHISFPTIIANDVKYSESVKFGKGCIICLSGILTVNIEIGDFVIMNLDCTVGHDVIIEDYVTMYPSINVSGNVRVGNGSEIGTGTQIIQGKNIGSKSIIGAGSVVVKDIPTNCTAVGVPAVPIKFHNKY